MLAILGEYLQNLNSEIESYEQLIAEKREEAQKLTQLQGKAVEALGLLKSVVDELSPVDLEAIAMIKTTALQIFDNCDAAKPDSALTNGSSGGLKSETLAVEAEKTPEVNGNGKFELKLETVTIEAEGSGDSKEAENGRSEENPNNDEPSEEEADTIKLSDNVIYEPEKTTIYAGINAYSRAKAWGEWLCFTHEVGKRFEVRNNSRFDGYSYDLVVSGIEPEDAQRVADADLTKQPSALENSAWQPQKRQLQPLYTRHRCCQPGDLAVGDIARKEDGRQYRIIGVSEDGSVVKVVNEDGMEMAFSVGALYLVKKAEPESDGSLTAVKNAFANGKGNGKAEEAALTIGTQVIIHSSRFQGKYDGKRGVIATEPSNYGVKVDMGEEDPIFFLKEDISLLK